MLWFLVACMNTQGVPTVRATEGEVEVQLKFHGELEAEKSVELVTPEVDDRPEVAFLAEHGTRVNKGDVVVRFDIEEPEKRLKELQAERAVLLTQIESQLAQLSTKLEDAGRSVELAKLDAEMAALRRTDSEAVSRIQREEGRVAEEKARIATAIAENLLARTLLTSNTDVRLLRLQVEDKDADIARYEERIARATMLAPSNGLLLHEEQRWGQGRVKVGTELWPGATVVRIPDLDTLRVRAWAHEVEAPRVHVGQVARIVLDAVPDQATAAEVTEVADLAEARGDAGIKHVEVMLGLDDAREGMKPGMSASASRA